MADTTKIIDKFSYDGVTYVLQDNNSGYTSNVGTVTGVKVNGTTINPQDGVVDLGNIATSSSIPGPATATPLMDGTAAVGTATKYAKEDHVHPSDTSKQATLVSGTNIKTINNESLLGSGNISIIIPSAIDASTIHTKAVAGWGSVANITSGEGVQF